MTFSNDSGIDLSTKTGEVLRSCPYHCSSRSLRVKQDPSLPQKGKPIPLGEPEFSRILEVLESRMDDTDKRDVDDYVDYTFTVLASYRK